MFLNYHIGCIVLGLLCIGCGSARVVSGLSAEAQHTAIQEQYSQCGSSTT